MKFSILDLGVYFISLMGFAVFNMGCESYHHHKVGLEIEINNKDRHHHHDNGLHKGDRHDHDDQGDHDDD